MTATNLHPQLNEHREAIRLRILDQAKTVNTELLNRLSMAASELEAGNLRGALSALDGMDVQVNTMRGLLQPLPWELALSQQQQEEV